MNLQYLIKYKSFISVEDMDNKVKEHFNAHRDVLTNSNKEVLYCLAKHSLSVPGACHLLISTIAKEIGVSDRTVQRSIKILIELGIISKHKTVKRTGQGASIYVIAPKIKTSNVGHLMSESCRSLKTHETLTASKDSHGFSETVSKNLITSSFNSFVNNNVINNVDAYDSSDDLKTILKQVYNPSTRNDENDFEQLWRIAIGRLKQYMKFYNLPYLQIKDIVIRCMQQLIKKTNVNNIFAMYSKMIERQVKQLFEKPINNQMEIQSMYIKNKTEVIPDWFDNRNEIKNESNYNIDFEAERLKILNKLEMD